MFIYNLYSLVNLCPFFLLQTKSHIYSCILKNLLTPKYCVIEIGNHLVLQKINSTFGGNQEVFKAYNVINQIKR